MFFQVIKLEDHTNQWVHVFSGHKAGRPYKPMGACFFRPIKTKKFLRLHTIISGAIIVPLDIVVTTLKVGLYEGGELNGFCFYTLDVFTHYYVIMNPLWFDLGMRINHCSPAIDTSAISSGRTNVTARMS